MLLSIRELSSECLFLETAPLEDPHLILPCLAMVEREEEKVSPRFLLACHLFRRIEGHTLRSKKTTTSRLALINVEQLSEYHTYWYRPQSSAELP